MLSRSILCKALLKKHVQAQVSLKTGLRCSLKNNPSSQTRGSFWSGGAVGLADAAGWAAGAGIGRWAGGAAGSLGGPATAVLGAFVGGRVGPYVCTFLASGTANFLCSRKFLRSVSSDEKDFQFVGLVTNEDAIGYYHNIMMTKLNENKNKYVSLSDSVDYGLIYQDIANYLREIGRYDMTNLWKIRVLKKK